MPRYAYNPFPYMKPPELAGGHVGQYPVVIVGAGPVGLTAALTLGRDLLEDGASALDVCEAVVRSMEDNPRFNAGRGAVFNEQGQHELDASIMDGATMRCGASNSNTVPGSRSNAVKKARRLPA